MPAEIKPRLYTTARLELILIFLCNENTNHTVMRGLKIIPISMKILCDNKQPKNK